MAHTLGPIVTAATVAALPRDVTLVEVWAGDRDQALERFGAGHLPGAVPVDRDALTSRPVRDGDGRHPLASPESFADGLGAIGIDERTAVLAYDRERGASAARLVYLLRILGQSAAVLDGGIDAWEDPLETGPAPAVQPVETAVRPWPTDRLVGPEEVTAHVAAGGVVLDARAADRYAGLTEPLDPVAGHIPGARSAPFADNLDRQGMFAPAPRLHRRYAELGADADTIVYCGSGVTACHDLLAIEHAELGLPRLYVGSWSHWITDPDRPVG